MPSPTLLISSINQPLLTAIAIFIHRYWTPALVLLVLFGLIKFRLPRVFLISVLILMPAVYLTKNTLKKERICRSPASEVFEMLALTTGNASVPQNGTTAKTECPPDYGFPSAHTATAFLLAFAAMGSAYSASFTLLAILVSFSRIYLGVHSLYDVFGGIFFAAAAHLAARKMHSLYRSRRMKR